MKTFAKTSLACAALLTAMLSVRSAEAAVHPNGVQMNGVQMNGADRDGTVSRDTGADAGAADTGVMAVRAIRLPDGRVLRPGRP